MNIDRLAVMAHDISTRCALESPARRAVQTLAAADLSGA